MATEGDVMVYPIRTTQFVGDPKPVKKRQYSATKRAADRARAKTRINIGSAFPRFRALKMALGLISDTELVNRLLDRVGVDDVVVKLECLLQLFQRCPLCGRECSVGMERDGWFVFITQKCLQCHHSRSWASHPSEHIIRDPQEQDSEPPVESSRKWKTEPSPEHESIKASVEAFKTSETESLVEGDDFVTVTYEGSDETLSGEEEKENPAPCDDVLNDDETESAEEEEEGEEEDTESCEEDIMDDDDSEDFSPTLKRRRREAKTEESDEEEEEEEEEECELKIPMVWCINCSAEFTRACFGQRHKRRYGCLNCGTSGPAKKGSSPGSLQPSTTSGQHTSLTASGPTDQLTPITESGPAVQLTPITESGPIDQLTSPTESGPADQHPESGQADQDQGMPKFQDLVMVFESVPIFLKHARQYHGVSNFREICPECGKFITLRNKLSGGPPHVCSHKARPHVCPICGMGLPTAAGLLSHTHRVHSETYELSCRYCLKLHDSPEAKRRHEQEHKGQEQRYHCPDCPQRFSDRSSWCSHRKSHWQHGRPCVCPVCKRGFRHASQLLRHQLVHSGQKPYSCDVCQRSFNQPGHLKSHMRLHTGERPFQCQQCGQSFNHNVSLKSHMQRHHTPPGQSPGEGLDGEGC